MVNVGYYFFRDFQSYIILFEVMLNKLLNKLVVNDTKKICRGQKINNTNGGLIIEGKGETFGLKKLIILIILMRR